MDFVESKSFVGVDFTSKALPVAEYENCHFENCGFHELNLSNVEFVECTFSGCDLSNAIIINTAFKDVSFENCKMLGLKFNGVNPFLLEFRFEKCQLDFSSFYQLKIRGTAFIKCSLKDADFAEADLQSVSFSKSHLKGALFENTNLEKADFRDALAYELDPDENKVKQARFSKEGVAGLLTKYGLKIS